VTSSRPSITDNFFWTSSRDPWPLSLENEENCYGVEKKLPPWLAEERETEIGKERDRERKIKKGR